MDLYDGQSSYEMNLELGYHLVMLFGNSNVSEFVQSGDKRVASKLSDEIQPQDTVLCIIAKLHVTKEYEFRNAGELILHNHPES